MYAYLEYIYIYMIEMEDLRKELMATHDTIHTFFRVRMIVCVYVCAWVYIHAHAHA
jgi:hypothetical protein